jgi:hypothetical protein
MKIDIHFIEFFIKRKYNMRLEDYYGVTKSVASQWRNIKFPEKRLHEFVFKEKTDDMIELLKKIY